MDPQAPILKAKIKLHNAMAPIGPVVNNIQAPSYKLPKLTHQKLKEHLALKNEFNYINPITLANDICKLNMKPEYKLLTLDIKDLYVNIPINETIHITTKLLHENGINTQDTKDLINILRTTLHQNYFQYNNTFYKPETGIAMGSPLPGIIAEIFLQNLEQQILKHVLDNNSIIFYNRYVDDIFIVYNQN
jgi:hypothetical protein